MSFPRKTHTILDDQEDSPLHIEWETEEKL